MSLEVCPVCHGRGVVQDGFYLSVGNSYYTTTNTSPETCRSCDGKGYIETYSEVVQNPELEELDERLKKLEELADTIPLQQSTAKTLNIAQKCCASCKHIEEGMVYTSNPPKFKCLLHQCWYEWSDMNSTSCDDWEKKE